MRTLVVALLGGSLAVSPTFAQSPAAKPQAPKAADAKAPEYDPKAEVTIKGVVEDEHQSATRGDHPGLHVMLRTETELVEVHTCPVRFMKELEFAVEKGDALTIVGSRPGGAGIVIAREIKKGQTSLGVRDKTGAPSWTR